MTLDLRRDRVPAERWDQARKLRRNQTAAERLLWEQVRRKQIGHRVHRQKVICGWIVDFYIPAAGLIVEVDGGYHGYRQAEDAYRDGVLRHYGFKVLRFTNEQVTTDTGAVVAEIRSHLPLPLAESRARPNALIYPDGSWMWKTESRGGVDGVTQQGRTGGFPGGGHSPQRASGVPLTSVEPSECDGSGGGKWG